jgi:hypothetical protein
MQVRQEAAALLVVRVGDAIAHGGALLGHLADTRHGCDPLKYQ